jgi:hypothetical protein
MGGGTGAGMGGVGNGPPDQMCAGPASEAAAAALDFTNNVFASPAPPGNSDPTDAPQVVVIGFDDIENTEGVTFMNTLLGSITNPDGKKAGFGINPNACYAGSALYQCGDGSLNSNQGLVTMNNPEMGNHTLDHLEQNSSWNGIPAQYKDMTGLGGWAFKNGNGPGTYIDQATWANLIKVNDGALKNVYGQQTITGFRAPRLEINDNGLQAIKAAGYAYDQNLEEILPESHALGASMVDTANNKGFYAIPWPYTLDNGSNGIWQQQTYTPADKTWVTNYPAGLWEIPVYQLYVPPDVGIAVTNQMLQADQACSADCMNNYGTPGTMGMMGHCFLSDGEAVKGTPQTEITSYDFNLFIEDRMHEDQWLAAMKHTFIMRFYGNRAPLTYGAHPMQYTSIYENAVLTLGVNCGYADVPMYSTYMDRQAAMLAFRDWIRQDPVFSKQTYFWSPSQLLAYLAHPYSIKTGKPIAPDAIASPDSNGLFTRLTWDQTDNATIKVNSGNSADIVFNPMTSDAVTTIQAGIVAGSLTNLSHIDIKYSTEVPFRIRLRTADGTQESTVLLGGVGGVRTARIRAKDFFPAPDALATEAVNATIVNSAYLSKIVGISFESASTTATGAKAFNTHILQMTLHGVSTANLCK